LIYILTGCQQSVTQNTDTFYTDKGGVDYMRVPLIKPYELLSIPGHDNWAARLKENTLNVSVDSVKMANVFQNIILLYSTNTVFQSEPVRELWVVIIPNKHVEVGFDNFKECAAYLRKQGVKGEIRLNYIENIRYYFADHDVINWRAIP